MSLVEKNLSDYIKPKSLTFNDNYYELTNEYVYINDKLNFPAYNILKDVNDVKTNNFSNLFLSKKQKNSAVLAISDKTNDDALLDITTTIGFYATDAEDPSVTGIWMVIDKTFDTYEMDTTVSSFTMVKGQPKTYDNYLFRLQCINERYCRISHTFGDSTYYLIYDDGFKTSILGDEKADFIYSIEGNYLQLYKILSDKDGNKKLYQVICVQNGNVYNLELDETKYKENDSYKKSSYIEYLRNRLILINTEMENLIQQVDSTWITYKRTNAIDKIDNERSADSLETQFLVHHEYSDDNDLVNIIPLKNNLTYQGTVTNAGNLIQSSNKKIILAPQVDLRNYTTINSGLNQELRNRHYNIKLYIQ